MLRFALKNVLLTLLFFFHSELSFAAEGSHSTSPMDYLLNLPLEDLQAIPIKSASLLPEKPLSSAATTSSVLRSQWQSRLASRIGDAIEHFPGVSILPFRFGAQAIAIRGFSGSNLPRGISLRWDDVPLSGYSNGSALVSTPNINLSALQRIEMVRGPASALFGSDAFHGVLSLYSLDEAPDLLDVGAGSNAAYDVSTHIKLPLFTSVRTSIVAATNGQGDQQQSYDYTNPMSGLQNQGERKNQYAAQTAIFKITKDQTSPLSFQWGLYWNQFDGERFAGPGRAQSPSVSALGDQDWSDSETDFLMTKALLTYQTDMGFSAEVNSYYWRADALQTTKIPRMNSVGENQVEIGDRRGSVNLVLRSEQPNVTQWALSMGYDHLAIDQGHIKALAPDNTILSETDEQFQGKSRNIHSILLEVKSKLRSDKLKFVYGGRIDNYSDFGLQKTPRFGIIFSPKSSQTFKLLYGQAFRAPTAFETYGIGKFKGNSNLEPEVIDTFELAATTRSLHWVGGINLFTSRWQKGIIRIPISDPNFNLTFRNIDDNRSQGLEIYYEMQNHPWGANISSSYIQSENRTQEQEFLAFPQIILNACLSYRTSKGMTFTLNNRVQFEASSGINNHFGNDETLPTYWRTDFAIESPLTQDLKWLFGIRNLLDRDNYFPSLFNAENGVPDQGRSLHAELRYRL